MKNQDDRSFLEKTDDFLDSLETASNTVKDGIKDARQAKRIFDYWRPSNSEQREQIEQEVKEWEHKKYLLEENFKILWVFMVIFALVGLILFRKIGIWLAISNGMLVCLILVGFFIIASLIFATIIFMLRK